MPDLKSFICIHWGGANEKEFYALASLWDADALDTQHQVLVFSMLTCQRGLWCSFDLSLEILEKIARLFPVCEVYRGLDAWRFLLHCACGLESKLLGETEIFGQFKQAWEKFCLKQHHHPKFITLHHWFQKMFEDVKWVRSEHMRHLGASSYGSLVRGVLKKRGPYPQTILCLGAGKLAESMLPFLKDHDVFISNRTLSKALHLKEKIHQKFHIIEWNSLSFLDSIAWDVWIFCSPELGAPGLDTLQHPRAIMHFGVFKREDIPDTVFWQHIPHIDIVTLEELLIFEEHHDHHRHRKLEQAKKACLVRSKMRWLGDGSSWEELSHFYNP